MRAKTMILIAWPVSVVLTAWLGVVVGIHFGTGVGEANYQMERVRPFQLDVSEASQIGGGQIQEVLIAVGKRAAKIPFHEEYDDAREELIRTIRELHARPAPPPNSPTDSPR